MNQTIYEQLNFESRKNLFIFICLVNKLSSNLTLGSIIKQIKLKHNNVFVNKLVNIKAQINYT